jgi:hypothetical protein
MKYFKDTEEFPKQDLILNILPYGVMHSYVSSTYLNGFINYVTITKAYVLNRYYDWNDVLEHTISIQDPPNSFNWTKKLCKTKNELYEALTAPGATFHGQLYDFQDDVVILARSGEIDGKMCYYVFWYDCDVSDSCIGRFLTVDSEEEVIKEFDSYVQKLHMLGDSPAAKAKEIPLHYFRGWTKW